MTYPDSSLSARLYMYYNGIKEQPRCVCGKLLEYRSPKLGFRQFCSLKCSTNSPEIQEKSRKTNQERYGGIGFASSELREKGRQTNKERHGDPLYNNPEKNKQTCLEKYGVENATKLKEVKDKISQTKLERYGDVNYNNRDRASQTCLERFGTTNPLASKEIQKKSRQTCLEKYGTEHTGQVKEFRDKAKKTNLEKYGTEYATQSEQVSSKIKETKRINTIENHVDIIDIESGSYICKCPHLECNKCIDKYYKINPHTYHSRKYYGSELCTNLLPLGDPSRQSSAEVTIQLWLDEWNIQYETNNRAILKGKEIDIYIPSMKIGIECNGVYWHSDKMKPKTYHIDKYNACTKQGIQLIQIWEDQLAKKPEIIESILEEKLGLSQIIKAQDCIIKEVDSKEANKFLEENCLCGKCNSSVRLGLYYGSKLVSLMCFDKKHQLVRFCNLNGYTIDNIKPLLQYYMKTYNPDMITSYSSNDISENIYEKLGFKQIGFKQTSYYIDSEMNRYKNNPIQSGLRAVKIYDSGLMKWQIK